MSIDRYRVVTRHNPVVRSVDPFSPLSVGNGEFAFTADVTGLQTFPEAYEKGIPLCTMAQWAWHEEPADAPKASHRQQVSETFGQGHRPGQTVATGMSPGVGSVAGTEARGADDSGNSRVEYRRHRYDLPDLRPAIYDTYGRDVGYPTSGRGQEEIYHWLRMNPHKFHLGRIGYEIFTAGGRPAQAGDLSQIEQRLDLWRGGLVSRFSVDGMWAETETWVHPTRDVLAFSVKGPLVKAARLNVVFAFPYSSPQMSGADFSRGERHTTMVVEEGEGAFQLARLMDETRYFVQVRYASGARMRRTGAHTFVIELDGSSTRAYGLSRSEPGGSSTSGGRSSSGASSGSGGTEPGGYAELFTCVVGFSPWPPREELPSFAEVVAASERHWRDFWHEGGMIDLGESDDPRALELERRVVLSQYLTAIQCAGSIPPQETGLTCNSWYGKFHLEMHWWHGVHFALWGRERLLEKSLWWYEAVLPKAKATAARQGYRGARWPKMVAFDGRESPSPIGPLLIWQQPHPIYYAELIYRARPHRRTLERYRDIVFETAEFMASYAVYSAEDDRYLLGPPVIPAQENHAPEETLNPAFEVEYWAFGLSVANQWRKRLGLPENPVWAGIAAKVGPLPTDGEVYLAHERCPDTFTRFNYDHPSMLGALGILPGRLVHRSIMMATLERVWRDWQLERMWGWDFPMMAMTAARLGRPDLAVEALLCDSPKNTYLPNGHNRQGPRKDLPLYLPGNGGLLTAVAMMAAGWDGGPKVEAPGFPKDGRWRVRVEGIRPMP